MRSMYSKQNYKMPPDQKSIMGFGLKNMLIFLNPSQIKYKNDGSSISSVGMLTLTTKKTKSDLSNTNGLIDFNATLSSNLETNAHYTIYYVINFTAKNNKYVGVNHKTNGGITDLTYTLFHSPRNSAHILQIFRRFSGRRRINIENKYYNKQVMFWIVKINSFKLTYGNVTNVCVFNHINNNNDLNKTFKFEFHYSVLRVGFSYNAYDIGGIEFNKMMEYEKKRYIFRLNYI